MKPKQSDLNTYCVHWKRRGLAFWGVSALLITGLEAGILVLRPPNPEATYMFGYFFGDTLGIPDVNGDRVGDLLVGGSMETIAGEVGGEMRSVDAERTYCFDGATGQWIRTLTPPLGVSGDGFGWAIERGRVLLLSPETRRLNGERILRNVRLDELLQFIYPR